MAALTTDNDIKFINPYNFVAKTKSVERDTVEYGEFTGKVTCILKVKDMLAIPDHYAAEGSQNFDFYKVDGKPVIPGSEIRGCIRSVYETVTRSCFSVINSEILHKREDRPNQTTEDCPEQKIVPGILKKNGDKWYLYEALKIKKSEITDNEEYIERKWITFPNKKRPEHIGTKYFVKANDNYVAVCDKKEIQKLRFSLNKYIDNLTNKRQEFGNIIEQNKKKLDNGEPVVVFYKLVNGVFQYFSFAQVSRCVFNNTVPMLLGEHDCLCGKNYMDGEEKKIYEYCPACSLFGTIGDASVASRIRFSDAVEYRNVRIKEEYCNLPELASPKITSVEFYSDFLGRGNNSRRWTYDDDGVQLKGRKYYYHHSPAKSESHLGSRSIATKPALSGSEFKFDIYFDKVSDTELKQILWVLTFGENDINGKMMHKLGFGKPVGYGSVKIVVDEIILRGKDESRYNIIERTFNDYNITDELFSENEAVKQLKIISNYEYVSGRNVSYPIADNGKGNDNSKAAHQWFTSNRLQNGTFRFVLPKLSEESASMELPAMTAGYSNSASGNSESKPDSARPINDKFNDLQLYNSYDVQITEIKEKNGQKYAYFRVNGKSASVNTKYISKEDCKVGRTISVIYKGLNNKGFPDFFVNRK